MRIRDWSSDVCSSDLRDGDDLAPGAGLAHAERGRQRPAERAGLVAVDPVARVVDVEELRGGDLRQADGGDVAGIAAASLVHLMIDALWLSSEEHTSELQSLMRNSYAVSSLKKKNNPKYTLNKLP